MKKIIILLLAPVLLSACSNQVLHKPTTRATPMPSSIPTIEPTTSPAKTTKITMVYQPMQCEKTPWEVWYELGEVNFFKTPSDTELITAYYSSQSIEIVNPLKIEQNIMVCEACNTCATTHKYTLQTSMDNIDRLESTGWKRSD